MASGILTAKQEAFAQHYAATRDGADSYRKAYDVKPTIKIMTCHVSASELLRDPKITARIKEIIAEDTVNLTANEALMRWMTIATADPNELLSMRVGNCRHCRGDNFGYQWKEREYLEALAEAERFNAHAKPEHHKVLPDPSGGFGFDQTLPPVDDCPECRGEGVMRAVPQDSTKLSPAGKALYGGLKLTRNGYEIIMADRNKALENACRIIGAFDDRVRLDASLKGMAAIVNLDPKMDPAAAAKLYEEFIARNVAS